MHWSEDVFSNLFAVFINERITCFSSCGNLKSSAVITTSCFRGRFLSIADRGARLSRANSFLTSEGRGLKKSVLGKPDRAEQDFALTVEPAEVPQYIELRFTDDI